MHFSPIERLLAIVGCGSLPGVLPSLGLVIDCDRHSTFAHSSPFPRPLRRLWYLCMPAGDILFYDRRPDGKMVRMGEVRSPSVSAEWSPCGRHLLTAVTAPRLRVDNAFKIFSYCGQLVSLL